MNSLGDQFKCVVALPSGGGGAGADDTTPASHFTVIMPTTDPAPPADRIAESAAGFCALHKIGFVDWGTDVAALLAAAREGSLARVSLLRTDAATFAGARRELLARRGPSLLLLELNCDGAAPWVEEENSGGEWSWIRPPPSCLAELAEEESRAAVCIPAVMRCSSPILQATPPPSSLLLGGGLVTLSGVLREVGYKVGSLPKYGS